MCVQANTAIVPNSLEQYVTAVEEAYNATSQLTTIEQPSGDGQSSVNQSTNSSGDGGFLAMVISTIGSFDNLNMLASAAVDAVTCASSVYHHTAVDEEQQSGADELNDLGFRFRL